MKKIVKLFMTTILIAGIGFSILNLLSVEINCGGLRGVWVNNVCLGDGNECDIKGDGFEEPVG
jgi:hypothetical protein